MSYTAQELMSALEQAVESVTGRVCRCESVEVHSIADGLRTDKMTANIFLFSSVGMPAKGGEE